MFSRIWDWYTRDMKMVRREICQRTWIIWHQRVGHTSNKCVPVTSHGSGRNGDEERIFNGSLSRKHERFPGIDCSVTDPTPRTLTSAESLPLYTTDLISEFPGSGFLQFWTVSAVFELRLVGVGDDGVYGTRGRLQQPELRSSGSSVSDEWADKAHSNDSDESWEDVPPPDSSSSEGEEDIDGLFDDFDPDKEPGVKLIISGSSSRAIGRIYVPTWWSGLAELNSAADKAHKHEFIVLCEARDTRAENFGQVDEDGGWRYRVMLVEPKFEGRYCERIAIGSVGRENLGESVDPLAWKEFILG